MLSDYTFGLQSGCQEQNLNSKSAELCLYKPWRPMVFSILKNHKFISQLARSALFECLCYGSTVFINV